uniref:Putative microtubule-associated protein n=1 Tax=Amblyomma aureolatum TaxID=187763 RepID=A0A1E1X439_9ACAR
MAWYPKIVTVKKDGTTGSEYPFPTGRCSVGGITGCDIHIRGAGPSHCLFIVDQNKQAHVVNVTGTADVQRNGEDVYNESFLSHGDIVQIGSRQFRFEWVEKRKKGDKSSEVAAASHQPEAAGDARESSALQNEIDNEAHPAQQSNGTPGACTPTTYSFDQSLFKTPRIPPEMFVSPLSASYSDKEYNGDEGGLGTDALGNSQLNSSSSSTPLIDEPRIRALRSSTSSTPLLDEPRTRARRSRSSLVGMVNSPLEQEQPAFQERHSHSLLKRRSQSCQTTGEERSSKLRRSDSYGPARRTSLACHSNANGQSGPSSRSSSAENCTAHVEAFAHPGTSAQFFAASTPVTRTARNGRVWSDKALKSISFSHQEKNSGFVSPGAQSFYSNGNAATDESFLDSPGLSRRALRSSQASLSHASLSASADSLGFASLFKTPNRTDSIGKEEFGSFMTQDMSNSSLGDKLTPKRLSSAANEGSQQSQAKSVSSRSRHPLENTTNGAQTPSDRCTRSARAMSSLGQNSEHSTSVRKVATVAETVDSHQGSDCEGHSGTSTLGSLEQEKGVSAKKTRSKHTVLINSTLSFKESPEDKPGEVSARAARSRIANSAAASQTWSELCSEGVSPDTLSVSAGDSKRALRRTRLSCTPNRAPASEKKSRKAESPEQEGAVTSEEGNEEQSVPGQAVQGVSQSEPELLERILGVVAECPRAAVSRRSSRTSASKVYIEAPGKETVAMQILETPKIEQTLQCSNQMLENNLKDALEKSTLPTRSGRLSHTPISKKIGEEVSELETVGTPSALKAPRSRQRQTLRSRNASAETDQTTVSTLSPGHMTLDDVDVAVEGSIRSTRSARFSHELVATKEDGKASEHEEGGMSATFKSSGAKQAPISEKEIEGMSKQKALGTPRSLKALAARQVPSSSDVNEDEVASTLLSKRLSLQNTVVSLEESFGRTRSTKSNCTPVSVSACVERSEQLIQDAPVAVKGSKGKLTPVSKLAVRGASKQKTYNTVLGGEEAPASHKVNGERIPEQETACTSLCKRMSLEDVGVTPEKCFGNTRSTRLSCTPSKCAKVGTPRQKTVGVPTSKTVSEEEKTPEQLEHMTFDCMDLAVAKSPSRMTRCSHISLSKKVTADPLEHETMVSQNPLKPGVKQVQLSQDVTEQTSGRQIVDTPKSLKASAFKRTSSKIKLDEDGQQQEASTSPSKLVSSINMRIGIEEPVRTTRSRSTPTSRSVDIIAPGPAEVGLQNPMGGSEAKQVPVLKNKALALETVNTPKSLKALEGKQTPASSKVNASNETTEEDIVGTSPAEHAPLMSAGSVMNESFRRSSRSSRTPVSEKLNKEALEHNTEGTPSPLGAARPKQIASGKMNNGTPQQQMADTPKSLKASAAKQTSTAVKPTEGTPSSLGAAGAKQIAPGKVNNGTPQQQMPDTPKSLKASAAKRTSTSKKIMEEQEDLKQTTRASTSKRVSFDNTSAVTEGLVRSTRSSLSSALRNVNLETPGLEEIGSQNPMGRSRVSRKSKEALAQETLDTPKSLKTSRGKQTPVSGKIRVGEEATEQDITIMGALPVKRSPLMSISPVVVESVGTRSTRSSRTPALENSSKEAPGDKAVDLTPSPLKATGPMKAVSRKVETETPQQQIVETPKSLKTSAAKRTSTSIKMAEGTPNLWGAAEAKQIAPGKVNNGTPQQQMADTPKSLKASAAKRTSPSKKIIEEKGDLKQTTRASPSKRVSFDNTCGVTEELVRSTRSSLSSTSRNVNVETPGLEKVGSQNPLGGSRVSRKSKEALAQETSFKTSGVAESSASGKISANETTEQDIRGTSPVELLPLVSISPVVVESAGTRSTSSSRTLASEKSNEGTLGDETVVLPPSSLKATGPKKAVSRKMKKETAQQQTVDPPNSLEASTAKWASTSKNVVEEDLQLKTGASPFKHVSSNDTCVVIGEPVRATRASQTPTSRNVTMETPGLEEVCLQETMGGSGAKRPAVSRKNKKASAQKPMDTPKSSKTSRVKQVQASNIVVADGEALEQDTVGTAPNGHVTFDNTDAAVEVLDRTRSTRASRTSSNEGELKVQAKEKEATIDSNQKPSSKPSKAKRTPASKKETGAEETAELDEGSMSPPKHVAFDNTNVTAAASGRATRAARSRCAETLKSTDVNTRGQEAEGKVSPLKALGAVQTLTSNKELGESPKQEAVDAEKSLRKILRAKTTRSTRKVSDGEGVPELAAAGSSSSKCSSAIDVHDLVEEPARPTRNTRGCRTRGSRKDNVEAPEENTADHPQSAKATRAKRTQSSRKVCKEDETPQDVAGSSLVMANTSQWKDETSDKELQGEGYPTKEVAITRKTRGKRKLDLKEEAIAEKHNTAEELIGIVAEKRGRRQQRLASAEDAPQQNDAQRSNYTEEAIHPKNTRSGRAAASAKKTQRGKATVDDAQASPTTDSTTVEPASASGKPLSTASESKRSKRKVAAVKVDAAQTATEETPKKTRGRRAKALQTVLEYSADDDKRGASQRTSKEHSEEVRKEYCRHF